MLVCGSNICYLLAGPSLEETWDFGHGSIEDLPVNFINGPGVQDALPLVGGSGLLFVCPESDSWAGVGCDLAPPYPDD